MACRPEHPITSSAQTESSRTSLSAHPRLLHGAHKETSAFFWCVFFLSEGWVFVSSHLCHACSDTWQPRRSTRGWPGRGCTGASPLLRGLNRRARSGRSILRGAADVRGCADE
eukprot:3120154-Rhodomonas_salina.1